MAPAAKQRKISATTKVAIAAPVEETAPSDSSSEDSSDEEESAEEPTSVAELPEAEVEVVAEPGMIVAKLAGEGWPSALEAIQNPVVHGKGDAENVDGVTCTICPTKRLKEGRMLEVHLTGKEHLRRLARFKTHVEAPAFPVTSQLLDARDISNAIDAHIAQTGASLRSAKAKTDATAVTVSAAVFKSKKPKADPEVTAARKQAALARKEEAKLKREVKSGKVAIQKSSKKEKFARIKAAKALKNPKPEPSAKRIEIRRVANEVAAAKKAAGIVKKPKVDKKAAKAARKGDERGKTAPKKEKKRKASTQPSA